ncbi:MAG: glycosyltransferase family 2 protein [Pseudomonadota bacterium]
MPSTPELSVIIPVLNEEDAVIGLAEEIAAALDGRAYEMIFVDDGSSDDTFARLVSAKKTLPTLRILRHRETAGQSRAIRSGVEAATGRVIATIDGDGQNDPADLPELYRQLTRSDAPDRLGLVIGDRVDRRDNLAKRMGSVIGNRARQLFLKDQSAIRDSACGIKVLPRAVFLRLPYFDHMHRFMPALVSADGHTVEVRPVRHRPRSTGQSKYTNIGRAFAGLADLRAVAWLAKRRRDPGGIEEG